MCLPPYSDIPHLSSVAIIITIYKYTHTRCTTFDIETNVNVHRHISVRLSQNSKCVDGNRRREEGSHILICKAVEVEITEKMEKN